MAPKSYTTTLRREGEGDIWIMNANGSAQRRLTSHRADDTNPSFSPDGKKILFVSDRDGDYDVYAMNVDGSGVRQLTSNGDFDGQPSWSADGTQILFISTRDDANLEIYIMNADGTEPTRLTFNHDVDFSPRWAPPKAGIDVTEASVVFPNSSALEGMTVQEVASTARAAVVRIETDLGSGSGFIFDSDGLILTNNHVVSDASRVTVYLDDGTSYTGTVLGRDLVRDLAVVKIEATGLPYLELGT